MIRVDITIPRVIAILVSIGDGNAIILRAEALVPSHLHDEALAEGITTYLPHLTLFSHLVNGLGWLWTKGLPCKFWQLQPLLWLLRRSATYRIGDGHWRPLPAFGMAQ